MMDIVGNLKKGQNLSFEETKSLFSSLMEGKFDETVIIEILEAFIKNATIQNPGSNQWHIRWTYNGKKLNWQTTQISDVGGTGWFGVVDNELNQKLYKFI